MKVESHKQTYHNPISQIPVPAEFQMGNFDAIFMKKNRRNPRQAQSQTQTTPLVKRCGKNQW